MSQKQEGLIFGQVIGDALGAQVEFMSARRIDTLYPEGVRELIGGGPWNLEPGQITDDSELAFCLAHSLIQEKSYDKDVTFSWYQKWQKSAPFDCGNTTRNGLNGDPILESQANGALMRISPLAVAGINWSDDQLIKAAQIDASLTHPNVVCGQANALFVLLLRRCLVTEDSSDKLYDYLLDEAKKMKVDPVLNDAINRAHERYPIESHQEGWVIYAFHNALYQLLHAPSFEEALVDTIAQGGDTDTTAAIAGALMGAFMGTHAIPNRWKKIVLNSQPQKENDIGRHPRPSFLWASQTLDLTAQLIEVSQENTPKNPKKLPPNPNF